MDFDSCKKCGADLAVVLGVSPLTYECTKCFERFIEVYPLYAVVKVASLNKESRNISGTEGVARQPKIGDVGVIVYCHNSIESVAQAYEVESVSENGYTIWLATFEHAELEIQNA